MSQKKNSRYGHVVTTMEIRSMVKEMLLHRFQSPRYLRRKFLPEAPMFERCLSSSLPLSKHNNENILSYIWIGEKCGVENLRIMNIGWAEFEHFHWMTADVPRPGDTACGKYYRAAGLQGLRWG